MNLSVLVYHCLLPNLLPSWHGCQLPHCLYLTLDQLDLCKWALPNCANTANNFYIHVIVFHDWIHHCLHLHYVHALYPLFSKISLLFPDIQRIYPIILEYSLILFPNFYAQNYAGIIDSCQELGGFLLRQSHISLHIRDMKGRWKGLLNFQFWLVIYTFVNPFKEW